MITAVLAKNKQRKSGVFIQTDKVSELDFFCDLVREINDQRENKMTQADTLQFFQEVSGLVAEGFTEEDPEYVDWAIESAAAAMRIATEA